MKKLNELFSTAISGNNILSTSLYISSVSVMFAGVYAPIILIIVAATLACFWYIYTEIVEALPVNGGVYTCLLNSTSKIWASVAGFITFLAYVSAAVISAKVAIEYIHTLFPVPVFPLTAGLLFLFALIVISGIRDSAYVALGMFLFHGFTLIVFMILSVIHILNTESFYLSNIQQTQQIVFSQGGILMTIILAFSASALSITGFESAADFVEEQRKGVFRKILRNMIVVAFIFSPLITFLVLHTMPIDQIVQAQDFILAVAAREIGGPMLQYLVVVDAFLVLSGAVLTSYIGVNGLLSRMSLDNCLPRFLSTRNKKGSYPYIAIGFWIVSVLVLLLTQGDLLALAGVYTLAFLCVMMLYSIGNGILKVSRPDFKRTIFTPRTVLLIGFVSSIVAFVGNIIIRPENVVNFAIFAIPLIAIGLIMVYKSAIVRVLLRVTEQYAPPLHGMILRYAENMAEGKFVVFIQSPSRIFQSLDYIHKNESGRNITLVYCTKEDKEQSLNEFKEIEDLLPALRKAGVFPHFAINLMRTEEHFSPKTVREVAKKMKVAQNHVLIGTLHDWHKFDFDAFGGVRIIF